MNSKAKGNTFERKQCREFSLWLSRGQDDDLFWRTDSSGGRATQRMKTGKGTKNAAGDMGYTDPVAKPFMDVFIVEFKKGYTRTKECIDILQIVDGMKKRGIFWEWWIKLLSLALEQRKIPLLVMGRDFHKVSAATTLDLMAGGIESIRIHPIYSFVSLGHGDIFIYELDDFLDSLVKEKFFQSNPDDNMYYTNIDFKKLGLTQRR